MKVGKDKVVTLTYTLRYDNADGEVIQQVTEERPFVSLFGNGMLLPKFEANLDGLEPEETFAFDLTPKEGYGELTNEAIIDLEKRFLKLKEKLTTTFSKLAT